ncbi:MAG TPA: PqqD family protein [Candidatus Saccharimonadales bacterium]|nr:PqqD family protein [Candidatus Saccharimonadales bacterium]
MAPIDTNSAVVQDRDHPLPPAPLRYQRSSDSVSREIAGDTIVVPICRGVGDMDSVFTFNSLGTDLWKLLDQSRTEEELAVWVAEHFDVSFERARDDVRSFLDELRTTGLISSH